MNKYTQFSWPANELFLKTKLMPYQIIINFVDEEDELDENKLNENKLNEKPN